MKENRRRVIRISKEMLEMVLTGCKYGYTSTLPGDLEVIQVLETDRLAARSTEFRIVVQSETFEPVEEGLKIPEITPTFTKTQAGLKTINEIRRESGLEDVKWGNQLPQLQPEQITCENVRHVMRDGVEVAKFKCPVCHTWGDVDADQYSGDVSILCVCGFHETIDLKELEG